MGISLDKRSDSFGEGDILVGKSKIKPVNAPDLKIGIIKDSIDEGYLLPMDIVKLAAENPQLFEPMKIKIVDKVDKEGNPWVTNVSYSTAFCLALLNAARLNSNTKLMEASMNMVNALETFKLASQSAEMTGKAKMAEARKKMVEAMTQFAMAAVSAAQAYNTLKTQRDCENSPRQKKFDEEIKQKEAEIALIKGPDDGTNPKYVAIPKADDLPADPSKRQFDPTRLSPAEKERYDKLNERIANEKSQKASALTSETQVATQFNEAKFGFVKSTVQGAAGVVESGITGDIAMMEQFREQLQAILEIFRSLLESIRKSHSDLATDLEKMIDLIVRVKSEADKAHQLKG